MDQYAIFLDGRVKMIKASMLSELIQNSVQHQLKTR